MQIFQMVIIRKVEMKCFTLVLNTIFILLNLLCMLILGIFLIISTAPLFIQIPKTFVEKNSECVLVSGHLELSA